MVRDPEIDVDLREVRALTPQLSGFRPVLVVCGGTGVGKTTLVNTLIGRAVGAVGHFARGTDHPQRYCVQLAGREFDVIDLPGLGDAKERDRLYRPMYVTHLRFASGVILVVTPPRPAALPTQRSVKQVLQAGFSASRIVFAFNRLTMLNIARDRALLPVEIDAAGPVDDDGRTVVDQAARAFVTDLSSHIGVRFDGQQVMPCDALRGWNTRNIAETAVGVFAPHRHRRTP